MKRRFFFVFGGIFVAACGARTALVVSEPADAGVDAAPDVRDASRERDVSIPDVMDALPPIDAMKPDVQPPNDCPDASATLVYLVSSANELLSFYPPTLTFKTIGTLVCPNTGGATPFSMGVDRKGIAYVVYTNGSLYRVSTATAACQATSFQPSPMSNFTTFGMGFAGDTMSEQLYVAGSNTPSPGLASIDTSGMMPTYKFTFIGPFQPSLDRTELTGTGDGRLFGWSPNSVGSGSKLTQIDRKTAKLIGANNLQVGTPQDAFAFAFWGGDFYIFTGQGSTTVTKYDPMTQAESQVTSTMKLIVGAGVSTCAPSM